MPSLELFNRQRKKRLDLVRFRKFAELAMAKVSEMVTGVTLPDEIIVVFVSDARMTRIHRDFMSVDEPTDVITFQHGEIIISVETAERQAKDSPLPSAASYSFISFTDSCTWPDWMT